MPVKYHPLVHKTKIELEKLDKKKIKLGRTIKVRQ